jgi:hypothetical protein
MNRFQNTKRQIEFAKLLKKNLQLDILMVKKCIICREEAEFALKNASGYYCEECAKENFSDLELLQKLSEQAAALKKAIKDRL